MAKLDRRAYKIQDLEKEIRRLKQRVRELEKHHHMCGISPARELLPLSPCTNSEQKNSGINLEFVQFEPCRLQISKSGLPKPKKWLGFVEKEIGMVPRPENWADAWEERLVVWKDEDFDTGFVYPSPLAAKPVQLSDALKNSIPDGSEQLVQRVLKYATTFKAYSTSAMCMANWAAYYQLVYTSSCWLLELYGASEKLLQYLLQYVSTAKPSAEKFPKTYRRLLSGARYVNELVRDLGKIGWKDRASELLLYCKILAFRLVTY